MQPKPLLDDDSPWKQRMRAPLYLWASLARRNTARGLICSNHSSRSELYAWELETGKLNQLTDRPHGTVFGFISPDGEWVYYLEDIGGNEKGHFMRVPWVGGGSPQDATPTLPLHPMLGAAMDGGSRNLAVIVPEDGGYGGYLVPQTLDGVQDARRVHRSTGFLSAVRMDFDGTTAVWQTAATGRLESGLVATDTVTGETIGELWESGGAGLFAGQFSPLAGDSRMLADSDDSGARRAFIWDPRSGERTALSIDEIDGEVVGEAWSPDGEKILLRQAWRAQQQLWLYDIESSKARRLEHDPGVITLPGMWVPHFTEDGNIETVWENSANTPRSVLLDGTTGRKIKDLLPVPELPPARAWRSFECDTPDGDRIQCWLATPEGTGPFPTVLETHGGPTAVTLDMFHPASQAYLDHGFAFCSVNYRGSTGFGRDYERKIWGCLGKWEVEDMVAARQWLVDEGIAHADNIFLTGGSYGGYLTLQALGTKPDLWAGGVALVAIADWTALYDEAGDMLRGYQRGLFEGTPDEKPEQYAESSPVTHVEDLKAPVLIIQGRNDARCPAGQMEAYVAKARSLGKPVEIEWFDAGHGAFDTTITVAWMEKRLQFFYDHLHQT